MRGKKSDKRRLQRARSYAEKASERHANDRKSVRRFLRAQTKESRCLLARTPQTFLCEYIAYARAHMQSDLGEQRDLRASKKRHRLTNKNCYSNVSRESRARA